MRYLNIKYLPNSESSVSSFITVPANKSIKNHYSLDESSFEHKLIIEGDLHLGISQTASNSSFEIIIATDTAIMHLPATSIESVVICDDSTNEEEVFFDHDTWFNTVKEKMDARIRAEMLKALDLDENNLSEFDKRYLNSSIKKAKKTPQYVALFGEDTTPDEEESDMDWFMNLFANYTGK